MKNLVSFGKQLCIDGYNGNPVRLNDLKEIYNFLDLCPDKINMTKIMPPYVFRYQASNEEDSGISGFVVIAQSHISIHSFPIKGYVSVDIFSCEDFDIKIPINLLTERFFLGKLETQVLNRGLEFPRNIGLAKNIVSRQRENL